MTENEMTLNGGELSENEQSRSSFNRDPTNDDDDFKENRKFPKPDDDQKSVQLMQAATSTVAAAASTAMARSNSKHLDETNNSIDWYTRQYEAVVQRNAALLSAYHQYLKPQSQQLPLPPPPSPLPPIDRFNYQNHALLAAQYAYHQHQNPYLLAASMCQPNGLPPPQPQQMVPLSTSESKFHIFSPNFNLFPTNPMGNVAQSPSSPTQQPLSNVTHSDPPPATSAHWKHTQRTDDSLHSDNDDDYYENEMLDDMDGDQSLNDTNGEWTYEEQFKQVCLLIFKREKN
jgi:hypothetical protein